MCDSGYTLVMLFVGPFCGLYTFGHYVAFLAIFFGVNLLFGAWDGFYGKLYSESSAKAEEDKKKWLNDTARLDIPNDQKEELEKKRLWNTRIREWTRTGGRLVGRITVILIALSFFFVPKNTATITGWGAAFISLAALLPVMALVLMWRNAKGLEKIRANENAILREAGQAGITISAAEERIQQTPPSPPSPPSPPTATILTRRQRR